MVTWVNHGSIADVSDLSKGSIGVKTGSMAATNTVSVTPEYGAPGTESESVPASEIQSVPVLDSEGPHVNPGDDGKPKARGEDWQKPPAPSWGKTTTPNVVREK